MNMPSNSAHFEQIENAIHKELIKAKSSVKLCVAWIKWDRFALTFERLSKRGVTVALIYDDNHSNRMSLRDLPSNVESFPVKNSKYLMHNKFCIIDDETVITGSYNWSFNAWNHFENIVVIKNDYKLTLAFLHEFEDLKYHSGSQAGIKKVCPIPGCKSHTFNMAIMGSDIGLYENVALTVWEVCATRGHARRLRDVCIDHLRIQLGLVDQPEYDSDEEEYSKEKMLHDFCVSRNVNKKFENLISDFEIEIHAVGEVIVINDMMVIEYNESPDKKIFMHWRHMRYRKIIPQIYPLDDMDSEDIDLIFLGG